MKINLNTFFIPLATALAACDVDERRPHRADIEVPKGYALSAGTSTIFSTSSFAYDSEAEWVTGDLKKRFMRGDKLYDDARTSGNGYGGGLGPVYAGYSCGSCHRNAGRTKPALWEDAEGSGSYGFSSMLVYVTRKNGVFFQDYGRVIHDQAIYGVEPEGKLKVTKHYQNFSSRRRKIPARPPRIHHHRMVRRHHRPEDLFCTVRIPLRHVGMGLMMAIDPTKLSNWHARATTPNRASAGVATTSTSAASGASASGATRHSTPTSPWSWASPAIWASPTAAQTIHPYSDFLLHDMGSEIMGVGLNDNYVSGLARGNEWRTTPLWGVGLQEKVNGHTYFLHDGRARNFTEAIMWHGGEGEASKNKFKNMSRDDRHALVRFLESL